MNSRRRRSSLLAGLVAAAVALGPAGPVSPAASATPTDSQVRGAVLGADGRPLAGASVELAVVPLPDASTGVIAPRVVARGRTDRQGRYALEGLSRASLGVPGPVELIVTASRSGMAVRHILLLEDPLSTLRRGGATNAASPLSDLTLQMRRGAVLPAADGGAGIVARARSPLAVSGGSVEKPPSAHSRTARRATVAATGASSCKPSYSSVWVPQHDRLRKRDVPVQRLRTRRHSTQVYEWETTSKTSMDVAFTGAGGSYAGGLTRSKENETGLGVKLRAGNRTARLLKVEWEYKRYRLKCVQAWTGGDTYWLKVYQWRPNRRTGGSERVTNEATWKCNGSTTVNIAVETWVARSSNVIWKGWFSISGVQLDAKQTNTDKHKLTITPDAGERDPRVCGDTDYPPYADRVKERTDA